VNTKTIPEANRTLQDARKTLGTANDALSEGSPLEQNVRQTFEELQRSARSLRVLTDFLARHPESLIRGKPADVRPEQPSSPPPVKDQP
jgi:paraquat-inducible protein B